MPSLNPYISFRDNAREAMEFYQSVLGGDLQVMTFDGFQMGQAESDNDKVMHSQLSTPNGFVLMASDTPPPAEYREPQGMSISLSGDDEDLLRGLWDGLSDGATITMPLEAPPWGGLFGMLVDRFGIAWMVAVNPVQ